MDDSGKIQEIVPVEELVVQKIDGNNSTLKLDFGMLFDTNDDMFAYYKAYGKQEGFPVKRQTQSKGSDGLIRYVTFTCGRGGKPKKMPTNPLNPKPLVKIGCLAKMGGCINEDGKWVVRTVVLEHNHGVSPEKARFFRCNRSLSASVKRRLEINDRSGIGVAHNYKSVVNESGGHENTSFGEKDCRNYIESQRRLRLGDGDAIAVQRYFMKMQSRNDGFYFNMDLDPDDSRLVNVFWVDSRSRAAYKAMQKAIEIVFPNSRHRWCIWHIMKKVPEKFGAYKEFHNISYSLNHVVF